MNPNLNWTWLLFSFRGRLNRNPFWIFHLAYLFANGSLQYFSDLIDIHKLQAAFFLIFLWPLLAVNIKRWHDRDKSGWWVLILLIPFIGFLWTFLEAGCLPGTPGQNKFGLNPLGASSGDAEYIDGTYYANISFLLAIFGLFGTIFSIILLDKPEYIGLGAASPFLIWMISGLAAIAVLLVSGAGIIMGILGVNSIKQRALSIVGVICNASVIVVLFWFFDRF